MRKTVVTNKFLISKLEEKHLDLYLEREKLIRLRNHHVEKIFFLFRPRVRKVVKELDKQINFLDLQLNEIRQQIFSLESTET